MTVRIHIERLAAPELNLTPTEAQRLVATLTTQLRAAYTAEQPGHPARSYRVAVHTELPARRAGAPAWGHALARAITTGIAAGTGSGANR